MRRLSLTGSVAAIALLGLLAGCGTQEAATKPARSGKVKVLATTGMIADIAKYVGGEQAEVEGLMGAGVDPHLYKANESDIRKMAAAEIIFYNGLNLEGKMGDIFVRMARKKPAIAVTELIDEKLLREPPEMEGHHDPHVWFDVLLWSKAVSRVGEGFAEIDPPNRQAYLSRAAEYTRKFEELHAWCRSEIALIPKEQRVLVTAHDAFGYFGRAYDIEVKAIQGISTESEASLKEINGLIDVIVQRKVKAVFVESSVPRKNIEALVEGCKARGHALKIGGELFSDALGESGSPEGTYIGMVKHNVSTIVNALK